MLTSGCIESKLVYFSKKEPKMNQETRRKRDVPGPVSSSWSISLCSHILKHSWCQRVTNFYRGEKKKEHSRTVQVTLMWLSQLFLSLKWCKRMADASLCSTWDYKVGHWLRLFSGEIILSHRTSLQPCNILWQNTEGAHKGEQRHRQRHTHIPANTHIHIPLNT